MNDDPRVIPARPDLAALHLRDEVEAETYASGAELQVAVPLAPVTGAPDGEAEMISQLIYGEAFTAYEMEGGWAWGQCAHDNYVGYVPEAYLEPASGAPTHKVIALQALVYPEPELKARPIGALPFGACVTKASVEDGFAQLNVGGWTPDRQLKPIDDTAPMWVSQAQRFLGAPYLWGGRSPAGFDCSGLIQVAMQAAGRECPRDSDQQMAALGRDAPKAGLKRGDLVFWKGHVGVMTSPNVLLHANAHHMEVAEEPFETAAARIAEAEFGGVLAVKRITG